MIIYKTKLMYPALEFQYNQSRVAIHYYIRFWDILVTGAIPHSISNDHTGYKLDMENYFQEHDYCCYRKCCKHL